MRAPPGAGRSSASPADPAEQTGFHRAATAQSSLRRAGRSGALSILDQSLFSGTNFVTAVLIGRTAGAEELGIYALCFSLVMTSIAVQRALLVSPFVVVSPRLDAPQRQAMRASMLWATLAMGGSTAAIAMFALTRISAGLTIVLAIALAAGFFRDFHRRLALADSRLQTAIWIDAAIACLQISTVAALAMRGALTATSALLFCSLVWVSVSILSLFFTRHQFAFRSRSLRADLRRLWPIGRWVGLSQLVSTMQAFALPWIMAIAHSMELAGIYAACWTLVQVASPAIEGLGNILGPALARSAGESRHVSLRRKTWIATGLFAALMLALLTALLVVGRSLLGALYGEEFVGHYLVLIALTLAATLGNVGIPSSKALTQLGHANMNFIIATCSLVVTLVFAALFLSWWGDHGAALGLILGSSLSTIARSVFLERTFRQLRDTAANELLACPQGAT